MHRITSSRTLTARTVAALTSPPTATSHRCVSSHATTHLATAKSSMVISIDEHVCINGQKNNNNSKCTCAACMTRNPFLFNATPLSETTRTQPLFTIPTIATIQDGNGSGRSTVIGEKKELAWEHYDSRYENVEGNEGMITTIDGMVSEDAIRIIGDDAAISVDEVQCDSVMRKRRRKMKKHKHRKRLKKTRIQRRRMGKI